MRAPGPCAPTARTNTNATKATPRPRAPVSRLSPKAASYSIAPIPGARERRSLRLPTEFTNTPFLLCFQEFPPSLAEREGSARKKSILISRIVTHARLRSRSRRSCAYEAGRTSRRIRRIRRGIGSMQDRGKRAAGDERGDRFNLGRQRAVLDDFCRRSPHRRVGLSGECSGL